MIIDNNNYGWTTREAQQSTYLDWQIAERPNIQDRGYCPVIEGVAVGRYKYYVVAEHIKCDMIVMYRDLDKYGYKSCAKNWSNNQHKPKHKNKNEK